MSAAGVACALALLLGGPGAGVFADAARVDVGGLVIEARVSYFGEGQALTGVTLHVTNASGAPIDVAVESLELWPVGGVAVDGLWYHDVDPSARAPYVEVRKGGRGPLSFAAPPSSTTEVMLTFAGVRVPVYARRVVLRVGDHEPVVVAGPVRSIGFSPMDVDGR